MLLVKYLVADHDAIRSLMKELKAGKEFPDPSRKDIFEELATLVHSHAKAEEATVYTPSKVIANEEIHVFAREGFQEHALVDELITKLKSTINDEEWEAQAKVLCELLDHHLDEEEDDYFPKLKEVFSKERAISAAQKYIELRQQEQPSPSHHPGALEKIKSEKNQHI